VSPPLAGEPCADLPPRPALDLSERIRVVEILATGTNGGAQENVRAMLARLDDHRYDVSVISLSDGSTARRIAADGTPVTVIEAPDDGDALDELLEALREREPHVLHLHMHRASVLGTLAALRLEALGMPRPYVISTVHSSRVRSTEDQVLLRQLTPSMDRLIAVSQAIAEKLHHEGRILPDGPALDLIYNGVDLSVYDRTEACCTLPQEYGFEEGTPLVGCVARLEPEKGQPTLLDAWPLVLERVPEARLLMVGEGSRREALEAQARELGLLGADCAGDRCVGTRHARPGAKVVFTGRRDDVPSVTAALDVAVLPSYREALGLVVLEAMALGRPVVASAVGGIPEMIDDGRTGLLVPPHDPEALAAAIVRLLRDHPFADTIAKAGHDQVHQRFCIQLMVRAIEGIYDEGAAVVAERSRALAAI
jgi:glycosyltransferase involved in cell wall biosynthesis